MHKGNIASFTLRVSYAKSSSVSQERHLPQEATVNELGCSASVCSVYPNRAVVRTPSYGCLIQELPEVIRMLKKIAESNMTEPSIRSEIMVKFEAFDRVF